MAHFTPALFTFLKQLKKNNDRDWFKANRDRYLEVARDPMLEFIEAVGRKLRRISPRFVADPAPVGGSLFRINRDTRFSKDKSPYKTNIGAHFKHEVGKDVHAPGMYLHLAPDRCFIGCGLWRPDGPSLGKIRDAIVEDPATWRRATGGKAFKEGRVTLQGDSLKRPPRGYDPEHPCVEDLKRKDFTSVTELDQKTVCADDFLDVFIAGLRDAKPLMKWLTEAVELEF